MVHAPVIIDLDKAQDVSFDKYEWVIIGSPIYMEKVSEKVRSFCQENIAELLQRKTALFISCTTPEQVDEYFKKNFPQQLYETAQTKLNFGGELKQDRLNLYERKITDLVFKKQTKPQGGFR